jgi:hypothetical protein
MICFQVSSLPKIGDCFTFHGRDYKLITFPEKSMLQGGLFKSTARFKEGGACIDETFYFEVSV